MFVLFKVNHHINRVLASAEYGRLAGVVTRQHIPDLILHIVACRILTTKDLFSYILYFVVNNINYSIAYDLLQLNFTFNNGLMREFDNIWEHVDNDWVSRPNWFTYNVNLGGVYYIDGRKKASRLGLNFDWCDLELVEEFYRREFEWQEFRLIWDPNFGDTGGYRLWRYDRELPDGASWAVERLV